MKSLHCTILLLAAAMTPYKASAFAPLMPVSSSRPSISHVSLSMVEEAVGSSDISIPYDAAARLAYDSWRAQYDKGEYDPNRYLNFKNNYETIVVANVIAKKRAREDGTVSLSLMTLNEFGDLSESEYKLAVQSSTPTSTGEVLSKALEAAELQVQASTALGEAADALAEEEQVRIYRRHILCFVVSAISNRPHRHLPYITDLILTCTETYGNVRIGKSRRARNCLGFIRWDRT
jgi:hypothetical protein